MRFASLFPCGWACLVLIGIGMLLSAGLDVQAQDDAPRHERPNRRVPRLPLETAKQLAHEHRVLRASWIRAAAHHDLDADDPQHLQQAESRYQAGVRLLSRNHFAVLDGDSPGITLHLQAPAIEPMTRIDLLFEGRPASAQSLGQVIDLAITRARDEGAYIERLTLTGHAGLPGCCALGSRLEDCVFEGRLSQVQIQQFRRLRPYLAEDAIIEIRQCSSAQGEEGTALLTAIHNATRCAVLSYVGDFRFGFSERATYKHIDADGRVEEVTPVRGQ